jgi:hypothetical protein
VIGEAPPLSERRLVEARETLKAAFRLASRREVVGAIDVHDLPGVLIEAERNLGAIIGELHGQEAWERAVDAGTAA